MSFWGNLTTKKTRWKESIEHCLDLWHNDICFNLSLSLSFFYFFLFLFISLSYSLLNKIHTIDFGIWSCLHLNPGRSISNNFKNQTVMQDSYTLCDTTCVLAQALKSQTCIHMEPAGIFPSSHLFPWVQHPQHGFRASTPVFGQACSTGSSKYVSICTCWAVR